MRLTLLLPLVLLTGLAPGLGADEAGHEACIELYDGSVLHGRIDVDRFTIQSALGRLHIACDTLYAVERTGDRFRWSLEDENVLHGRPQGDTLRFHTVLGPLVVPWHRVRRVVMKGFRLGLVLHYTFDDDDGGRVHDTSGRDHHGTTHGAVTFVASPWGRAARLRSPSTFITCDAKGLDPNGWQGTTAALWVYVDGHTTYGSVLHRGNLDGTSARGMHIQVCNGPPRVHTWAGTSLSEGEVLAAVGSGAMPEGRWVHIAAVVDGRRSHIYVDGRKAGSSGMVEGLYRKPLLEVNGGLLILGKCGGHRTTWTDSFLDGRIDDVRIYDRALTEHQVKALVEATSP